jgi:hypothetical protein
MKKGTNWFIAMAIATALTWAGASYLLPFK